MLSLSRDCFWHKRKAKSEVLYGEKCSLCRRRLHILRVRRPTLTRSRTEDLLGTHLGLYVHRRWVCPCVRTPRVCTVSEPRVSPAILSHLASADLFCITVGKAFFRAAFAFTTLRGPLYRLCTLLNCPVNCYSPLLHLPGTLRRAARAGGR